MEARVPARIYRAVRGAHLSDTNAALIGTELERLAVIAGTDVTGLTPAFIEESARAMDSPLHRFFTWDDEKAAYQYRLNQARYLARSWEVLITYQDVGQTQHVMRGLLSIKTRSEDRAYLPVQIVLETPEYLQQKYVEAEQQMHHWAYRYQQYRHCAAFASLESLFQTIEQMSVPLDVVEE